MRKNFMDWNQAFAFFITLLISTSAVFCKQRPNIVLIVADDLGWNDVSFHGSSQIPTPNIDALAYDGIILNNYYVQPLCTPTRSALMTGRYPIHTGMQHGVIGGAKPYGLGLDEKLLPQYLRELGYANHIVGKWHLGFFEKEYTPTFRGFDSHFGYYQGCEDYYKHTYWYHFPNAKTDGFDFRENMALDKSAIGHYSTELFTSRAQSLLETHNKSQPLFLYLPHQAVHSGNPDDPLQAPKKYYDKFPHILNEKRRKYAAMVSALDDAVGNVTKALLQAGLLNNTVIMFTTDNGGPVNGYDFNAASNWPLRGCKADMWEGGTRGAGFLWSPLLEKSRYVSPHLMHVTDWFPTVLSIAGYNMGRVQPDRHDGMDMWHTLSTNQQSSPRTDILYNIDGKAAALRVQNFKLIHGKQGPYSGWYPPWQAAVEETDKGPASSEPSLKIFSKAEFKNEVALSSNDEPKISGQLFYSDLPMLFSKVLGRKQRDNPPPVVVQCGERPANASTNCTPEKAPCLYDIDKDPCEFNNLALAMPLAVKQLMERLGKYSATAVSPRNVGDDVKGYPYYHNGNWVPWMNKTLF